MTDMEKLAAIRRNICWRRRDPSDPDLTCPCDGPADCEYGYEAIQLEDFEEILYDLHISPSQVTGLIEGTHVVVPVEPTEMEIECMARAWCIAKGVDPDSHAYGEHHGPVWKFHIDSARAGHKVMIKAAQEGV